MMMEAVNAPTLTQVMIIAAAALVLQGASGIVHPGTPVPVQPLCISQFALANHACASIPTVIFPPHDRAYPPDRPSWDAAVPSLAKAKPQGHHGRHRRHRDGEHHHPGHHVSHHLERHHRTHSHERSEDGHGLGEGETQTEAQRECCRWLRAVDDMCVCDLLVYLPVFLSRPAHGYTVVVDDSCELQFRCQGRRFLAKQGLPAAP